MKALLVFLIFCGAVSCYERERLNPNDYQMRQKPHLIYISESEESGYIYVQDETTGLCFLEKMHDGYSGITQIPCEAIPFKKGKK